jgi:hypothetical protein
VNENYISMVVINHNVFKEILVDPRFTATYLKFFHNQAESFSSDRHVDDSHPG